MTHALATRISARTECEEKRAGKKGYEERCSAEQTALERRLACALASAPVTPNTKLQQPDSFIDRRTDKLDVSTALGCYSDFRRRESDSHYNTGEPQKTLYPLKQPDMRRYKSDTVVHPSTLEAKAAGS